MNKRPIGPSDRAQVARDPLRGAVRRVLRLSAGVMATGVTFGFAPYASAHPFPAELELSSLLPANGGDGSAGFILNGIDPADSSSDSVSAAGDINGDGIGDVIIGAPFGDPGGRNSAGETYVVFGAVGGFAAEFELSSLLPANGGNGSAGFVLNGIDPLGTHPVGDLSGYSVSAAGDINGDGIDDLIIGAPRADPGGRIDAGESYVVFGRDTAQAGNFPAELELSSLLPANGGNGSAGFVLYGVEFYYAGEQVSDAGDVNGDGIDDLIVGVQYADPDGRHNAGQCYVVFGRDTAQAGNFPAEFELASLLSANGGDGSAGFVLNGSDADDHSCYAVSAAGDVNGDGIEDLIIGAYRADPGGRSQAGESYVVFGRDTAQAGNFPAELELSSLLPANGGNGSAGFVLYGINAYDYSGRSVSAAGDVNGDGVEDLIIGAYNADPGGRSQAGESYVVFGRDTAQAGNFPAELELASLLPANGGDGSAGFILNGIDPIDFSSVSVSAAGDINGDGIDDFIIGAPLADPGGQSQAGESYVVFGRDTAQAGNFPAELELSSLLPANGGNGSAGFVLYGIDANDDSGWSVSAAGDVDGDGIDDLIIGADDADPGGRSGAGESYVVFGRKDTDGDNIADALDNCSLVANADQRDTNGDGFGNICDPDLDNNGVVNFADLGMMKSVFFTADPDADLDGNGFVSFPDLGTLKAFFFLPPGPSGLVQATGGEPAGSWGAPTARP